jgi:hypothetical protein
MPHDPIPFTYPAPSGGGRSDPDKEGGPTPAQVGAMARQAIVEALDLLDARGTPLGALLAKQALERPDRLLMACARFSPNLTKQDLLPTIQAMHLQALRALSKQPLIIDQRPDDDWLS